MMGAMAAEPKPAGTAVLVRDGEPGLELLLLGRTPREAGKPPGPWVFPGGKIEGADAAASEDIASHACRAAARETHEEAGLEIGADGLVLISRWITPEVSPKRFDTWFFLGRVPADAQVRVDGSEMAAHRWLTPKEALAAHDSREMSLAPPTFVTVSWLLEFDRASDAFETLPKRHYIVFRPRIHRMDGGACILYPGDAGYEEGRIEHTGPLHRLWALRSGYRYERSPEV